MVYTDKADTLPPLYQRIALPVLHLLSPAYSLYMTQAPTITYWILKMLQDGLALNPTI